MMKMIYPNFYEMHSELNYGSNQDIPFKNNDSILMNAANKVQVNRREHGIDGICGDLQCIIVNTESEKLETAVKELTSSTNYKITESFENGQGRFIVLKCKDSADIIIKCRSNKLNPFEEYNLHPKSSRLPTTRLETFVFECKDINSYYMNQKKRGVHFLTDEIVETENYYFVQTIPSCFTGNSVGMLQWKSKNRSYKDLYDTELILEIEEPKKIYLLNIGKLDHAATRVKAMDRDSSLIEFMELTGYDFSFAIYINSLNSITNVARLENARFAMVFTSGIHSYIDEEISGPTEKFIHNYGTRVHHLAFETDDIDYTYKSLKGDGISFMSEVVGSEAQGIKQVFSDASNNTFLVNEYISRYGGFTGFFIQENVEKLTKATDKQ